MPFEGPQCQYCAATCSVNGHCPTVSLAAMPLRSCIGLKCAATNGTVCAECRPSRLTTGHTFDFDCGQFENASACFAREYCFWLFDNDTCVSNANPSTVVQWCKCNGAWVGPKCAVCGGPAGSTCTPDGDVVACDGQTYRDANQAPAVDVCGDCGGNGVCVGCDGVPHSGKKFDSCGVCGGDNSCLGAAQSTPLSVTFLVDCTRVSVSSNTVVDELLALQAACFVLLNASTEGKILPGFRCFADDFVAWAQSEAGLTSLGSSTWTVSDVYSFAKARGRLGEIGFDVNSVAASRVTFAATDVLLPVLTTASNDAKYASYLKMVQLAGSVQNALGTRAMRVYQTSSSWANAVAYALAFSSVKFTSGLGIAATFSLVCISFGSIRLGLLCAFISTFVLCGTLAVAFTQGWDLDAVMQICVAVVIAVACEHVIHIADGYQDFLQSTQSHMFAVQTTRYHAFRGALLRTGLSVISSTVAMVSVAAIFLGSAIQPFRRAAQVIITLHLLAFVGVILFGGWLCIGGPLKLFRHWSVSVIMCFVMGTLLALVLLIIFLVGGVPGPDGSRVL